MKLVAIVLAAGSATRFGSDKLAAELNGEPLLHHAIRAARAAPVEKVIVVCRPGAQIGDWMGSPPVARVEMASDELSASLKAGIAAAGDADGAFVFLGDMPRIPHDLAGNLAAQLDGHFAVMPRNGGRPGHPVLLSARAFAAIAGLSGDQGAGKLLKGSDDVVFVDCDDAAIHLDIDKPGDLAELN